MPWATFEQGDEFCVYKVGADEERTGETLGCHPTRAEAQEQVSALYASEKAGARHSGNDKADIQSIHDYAVRQGAECAVKHGTAPEAEEKPEEDEVKKSASLLEQFKGWLKAAFNGKHELEEVVLQSTVEAMKDDSGRLMLLLHTTNAFQDRDREIFMDKALQDYAASAEAGSPVDYWHTPWDFGKVKWTGYGEKALFELIEPNEDPASQELIQHVATHPDYWGASHRFQYQPEEKNNGVFSELRKSKSTLLPIGAASNPFTAARGLSKEYKEMDDQKVAELKNILSPDAFSAAMSFIDGEEGKSRRLVEAGVAHKEGPPDPPAEPAPVPDPPAPPEPEPAPPALTAEAIAAVLQEQLQPLFTRLETLEAKEKERADLPRSASSIFNPASRSPQTALTPDQLKNVGPGSEEPVTDPMVLSLLRSFGASTPTA